MKRRRRWLGCILTIVVFGVTGGILIQTGVLRFNHPSPVEYPVRGVDVSHYQGVIQWDVLAGQGIQFAFIKATEGSSFIDSRFVYNLEEAARTDLYVGAYHFFSFDSSGESQGRHFIQTVVRNEDMLPPVVDIEFYGDKGKDPPDRETTQRELSVLLERLEAAYGKKPILYATMAAYERYLKDAYERYPIWIRNVFWKPALPDRQWTFWQYSDKARLAGYTGEEQYIDMNVYCGDVTQFRGEFGVK